PLTPVSSYFRFALSPDGKWIVHTTSPDQPAEQSGNDGSHSDLWRLPASGPGKPEKLCRFPARIHDLCWAGGKALIVAAARGTSPGDLGRVRLAHRLGAMVNPPSGQPDEARPSASRDGRWLVYTDTRAGPTALVVREMATGEESTLRFDRMDHRRP